MRDLFKVFAIAILTLLGAFTATAFAAVAVDPDSAGIMQLLQPIIDAVKSGEFALAGAAGVIFLVAMSKKYLPDGWGGRFVRGDVGGMLTAFLYAAAASVGTALAVPDVAWSAAIALAALKFGIGAIGGYVALHKLATWLISTSWWSAKAPAWLQAGLAFVLGLIGSPAVARAEAAGEAAVAADPPTGVAGVAGKIDEVK